MNVVFLSHRVPFPPNKGEKIRTYNQIKYLADLGHDIDVFSPVSNQEDIDNLAELKTLHCREVFSAPQPNKLSYIKGLLKHQAISVANFYTRELQSLFDSLLNVRQVGAIVCTSSSMAEYIFQSAILSEESLHRPVLVMDFMDLDSDKWRQYQQLKPFPFNLIYRREAHLVGRYERRIHELFNASIFISQNEVDLFLKQTHDLGKLHVVANGLDTDFYRPASQPKPEGGPVLLFTGVMDYLPNEDAVVWFVENAWADIKERYPDAEFIIAGMSPSAKVKALESVNGIVVTGFVLDILQYYDKAHLFVAPFRLARGVQNKVLQSFACGLPTISTSMGCEGINCRDREHVLIADSIEAIVQAVDALMSDPELSRQLSENAVELIRAEFSWQGKLSSFEAILGLTSHDTND